MLVGEAIRKGSELPVEGETEVNISSFQAFLLGGHVGHRIQQGIQRRVGSQRRVEVLRRGRSVTIYMKGTHH